MSTTIDAPRSTEPEPITLRAKHDYSLTTTALEDHEGTLRALAKKTREGGYAREARTIEADADAIKEHILPVFRVQRELPLVTHDQLKQEIAVALRIFVSQAFSGLADPKVQLTPSAIDNRKDTLLRNLTERVTLYAVDVASNAFHQGQAARVQAPEAIALTELDTLRATG